MKVVIRKINYPIMKFAMLSGDRIIIRTNKPIKIYYNSVKRNRIQFNFLHDHF